MILFLENFECKIHLNFKKNKTDIVRLVNDVHLNTHVLVTQTLVFMYNLHVYVRRIDYIDSEKL